MFSRKDVFLKKTGPTGIGRRQFLKLLVEEYHQTKSHEAREQVLANLANFAYDPINYTFIKQLGIVDIFLRELSQPDEDLLHFAVAGICNLSSDPEISEYIVQHNGITLISKYLLHQDEEISINALTALIFLTNINTQQISTTPEIINKVLQYKSSTNSRVKNLSVIFLQDFCTKEQIEFAKTATISSIPLPE